MLEEVRITGLGVIDDALLELSPGFTALTGETGAGKTMVVTGLGLLFGGRADPARVRPGAQRASVEGRLRTDPQGKVAAQVEEAGGDLDEDGTLVLTRSVSGEGRSRAFAGGRSVPVSLLTYLADDLVAVHGQSDQQQLLKPGRQRESLDKYAGAVLAEVLADYQRAYNGHRKAHAELTEITTQARARVAEAAELRAGLTEIEKLNPVAGESSALRAEEDRLANADALHAAATTAHEALLGDPTAATEGADAVTLLGQARRALDAVRRHDAEIDGVAERLSEATYLLSELAGELASYVQSLDADPARLAAVQERRASLSRIIRLYGPAGVSAHINGSPAPIDPGDWAQSPADADADADAAAEPAPVPDEIDVVLDWARRAAARVGELDNDDERIAALTAEEAELAAHVAELAARLTQLRTEAGERFASDVTAELTALAMPHARISVVLTPLDEPGPHGIDDVEIRLASNPGAPALPLHKGASGGELSRVMLAIEVVFAGADPVPTFVFDEVDAGVGGKAAVEIGRRLAKLARLAQVIVVTHLPQVAAFADNHLVVAKSSDGSITSTSVIRLDHEARVRELSRMLAGLEDSEFGQAHAAELLAMAADQAARP
ncbi:MAG TPA: DNA repair protein RecN [Trebonia sp.]|jgi:DNA repair protein RecN (Recombination protein N)|nr:DNA repair protein RecN [Trebonia sp.]